MSIFDDLTFRIAKLELAPGDILIVKSARYLTRETAERLREVIRQVIPSDRNKCLVIEGDIKLSKITQSEIAKRAA